MFGNVRQVSPESPLFYSSEAEFSLSSTDTTQTYASTQASTSTLQSEWSSPGPSIFSHIFADEESDPGTNSKVVRSNNLGGEEANRRRRDRKKLWIFIAIIILLLVSIIIMSLILSLSLKGEDEEKDVKGTVELNNLYYEEGRTKNTVKEEGKDTKDQGVDEPESSWHVKRVNPYETSHKKRKKEPLKRLNRTTTNPHPKRTNGSQAMRPPKRINGTWAKSPPIRNYRLKAKTKIKQVAAVEGRKWHQSNLPQNSQSVSGNVSKSRHSNLLGELLGGDRIFPPRNNTLLGLEGRNLLGHLLNNSSSKLNILSSLLTPPEDQSRSGGGLLIGPNSPNEINGTTERSKADYLEHIKPKWEKNNKELA